MLSRTVEAKAIRSARVDWFRRMRDLRWSGRPLWGDGASGGGALFRVTLPVRSCAGPRLVGDTTGSTPEMIAAPRARIVADPAVKPTVADDAAA